MISNTPDLHHFVLVVGMVGVAGVQEVELGVVDLILLDSVLELLSISRYETRSLVNDVTDLNKKSVTAKKKSLTEKKFF